MAESHRQQNLQPLAWFWDLYTRDRLDLDPPYQRRSVWNQAYKDHFVDTVLLNFPAPAIFLYEELDPSGIANYGVVDGKQRLTTVFEFVSNRFPVGDNAEASSLRGLYFKDFPDADKRAFWSYRFLVEYLPSRDESFINDVFNRINKNVAKLTHQELRHARFDGLFIQASERLAEWLDEELPRFPRIASASRKQMKDVELVSQLLLLIEHGPASFSQQDLDKAYADREMDWPEAEQVERRFRSVVAFVKQMLSRDPTQSLQGSRLQNQADFYSLFGAISRLQDSGTPLDPTQCAQRLHSFLSRVNADETSSDPRAPAMRYFEDTRSASNDKGPRTRRIDIIEDVLLGDVE